MPTPAKECKWCGSWWHWPYQCELSPKNKAKKLQIAKPRKPIRKTTDSKWQRTRERWFKKHPRDWHCYICGIPLPTKSETTLDHVLNRNHSEFKYDLRNLRACCFACNLGKGSKSLGYYILERKKQGLVVSPEAYKVVESVRSLV